jgi:hypothetical protein
LVEEWYRWEEDDYPECPICKRSTPWFRPYKKDVTRIYHYTPKKGEIMAVGKCLWGCEFNAIIPLSWFGNKLIDPNNIIEEWK